MGAHVVSAIEQVGIRLETIGYMVYKRIADLQTVDDLIGGVVVFWWSRIRAFAERDRQRTHNAKSYEWVQWLAERLEERHARTSAAPAYELHRDWREEA